MGIMLISSRDKNPMIKCERKQLKIQKPQKEWVWKFQLKCMRNAWKLWINWKRKGKRYLQAQKDKNP